MEIKYVSKSGRVYSAGNEILKYRIRFPSVAECDKISRFYLEIAQSCESFCNESFGEQYATRAVYRFDCVATHNADGILSFIKRAELFCNGVREKSFFGANSWDISRQAMILPSVLVKKYASKGVKIKKNDRVFLKDGELCLLSRTDIDSIFEKKRR